MTTRHGRRWLRRSIIGLSALLVLAAIGFFLFAPGIVERSMNEVTGDPIPEVSAEARALHSELAIADMHSDTLMWDRSLNDRADRGRTPEEIGAIMGGNTLRVLGETLPAA